MSSQAGFKWVQVEFVIVSHTYRHTQTDRQTVAWSPSYPIAMMDLFIAKCSLTVIALLFIRIKLFSFQRFSLPFSKNMAFVLLPSH